MLSAASVQDCQKEQTMNKKSQSFTKESAVRTAMASLIL
jgi:hypothetical protein